jgi:hypothetical protein
LQPSGAVREHLVGEVLGVQAFALQPALHVGERDNHGVDLAAGDEFGQIEGAEHSGVARVLAHGPVTAFQDRWAPTYPACVGRHLTAVTLR